MRIEESIVIDRPRAEVFAYLADRRHDADWMGTVAQSEWLDPSEDVAEGRRGRMVLKVFGRRSETIDEVSEFVPGERIAHRTIKCAFLLNTACLTHPEGNRTRATVLAEADSLARGKLGLVADPLIARIMRRGFKADLRRLKRILEPSAGVATRRADRKRTEVTG